MNISKGSSTFLIKDSELLDGFESNFVKWLNENGFGSWRQKGYYGGINWIYVNINSKTYAFGLPSISIVEPIGNHAITIEEFMTIYDIYKKYNNMNMLELSKTKTPF